MPHSVKKRVFFLILFLMALFFLQGLRQWGIFRPFLPLETIIQRLSGSFYAFAQIPRNFWKQFSGKNALIKENELLLAQLAQTMVRAADCALAREDEETRTQIFSFLQSHNLKAVTARIIGQDTQLSSSILLLNKGLDHGIRDGFPVITGEGILVGKIFQTSKISSSLLLLSDPKSKVAVTVLNTPKTLGIASGELGLSINMNFIPQNEKLELNSVVISSGLEIGVPRGLVIGSIKEINAFKNELFQSAVIQQPIDYQKLSVVAVVLP